MAVSLDLINFDEPVNPIELSQEWLAYSPDRPQSVTLHGIEIKQRNWSRVGVGILSNHETNSPTSHFFLKQNIDRSGTLHYKHWLYEQSGANIARQLLKNVVRVPALKYHNQALLLNVFEYVKLVSVHELLHSNPAQFMGNFPRLMKKILAILEALQQPYSGHYRDQVTTKQRAYGSGSQTMNLKGLDIRNIGFATDTAMHKDIVLFDCVRPYLAPIEEAAAKIFISIGLLNWGKPLSRFIRGPDLPLLAMAQQYLAPYLDPQALRAELLLQSSFRFSRVQGIHGSEVMLKKLGLNSLGKSYLNTLQRWCDKEIPTR